MAVTFGKSIPLCTLLPLNCRQIKFTNGIIFVLAENRFKRCVLGFHFLYWMTKRAQVCQDFFFISFFAVSLISTKLKQLCHISYWFSYMRLAMNECTALKGVAGRRGYWYTRTHLQRSGATNNRLLWTNTLMKVKKQFGYNKCTVERPHYWEITSLWKSDDWVTRSIDTD